MAETISAAPAAASPLAQAVNAAADSMLGAKPATPIEPAPVAPAAPETKPGEVSERFAAAARREQANRSRELELKRKEAEFTARSQESESFKQKAAEYEKRLEMLKSRPDAVLREVLGDKWYDSVTQAHLNDGRVSPEAIEGMIDTRLKREQEAAATKQREDQERSSQTQKAQQQQWVQGADDFLKSDPSKYELTARLGGGNILFEEASEAYQKTGRVLTFDEAATQYESKLKSNLEELIKDTKVGQAILAALQPKPPEQPAAPVAKPGLTNGATSVTPTKPPPPPTSAAERERRAIEAVNRVMQARASA